jgi:hypothetical protein
MAHRKRENRPQRVFRCTRCGRQAVAGKRGPLPATCAPCAGAVRRRNQLGYYLHAAERIAKEQA